MDKLGRLARILQPTLFGVALLLGGLGFYYYRYLPARENAQTDRMFRQLDEMSDQMIRKLETLTNSVQSAAVAALAEASTVRDDSLGFARQTFRAGVDAFVPRLGVTADPSVTPVGGAATNRSLTLYVERQGSRTPLVCRVAWSTNGFHLTAEVAGDFNVLMAPIVSRHEFQDLMLISADGDVFSQTGPDFPRLERLPPLVATPTSRDGRAATNLLNLAQLGAVARATAEIAGRRCLVFLEPLPVSLKSAAPTGATQRWFLAGILEVQEQEARARPLPYFLVFGFVGAVVLLAILLPFLNILTAGSRSPIQSQHVVFLICATLAGSCGLVVLAAQVAEHWHQEAQLDRQLGRLNAEIEHAFRAELGNAVRWLGGLSADALHAAELDRTNRLTGLATSRLRLRLPDDSAPADPPARLRFVQWVQTNGMQAVKWSTSSNMTPMVWVGDRQYLRGILNGRTQPEDMSAAEFGTPHRFIALPLNSRLRSENVLACAVAAPTNQLAGQTGLAVVCAEFEPVSLMRTLLPSGFHFAVVDRDGQVQFHSDDRRNLRENLLVECDGNARLRAAIRSRRSDAFYADYYQLKHRLQVTPISGLPWTLVAMREHRLLDSIRASQTTVLATLLAAAGTVVALILWTATAVRRITAGRGAGLPLWFWPNQACPPAYWSWSLVHSAVLAGAVVLGFTQFQLARHPGVFIALFLLGPICVALSCLCLWHRTRTLPAGQKTLVTPPDQRAYVAWLATALAAMVLPCALSIHRVVAEIEAERFVRWTDASLAESLRTRAQGAADPKTAVGQGNPGLYLTVFQDTTSDWRGADAITRPADEESFFLPLLQAMRPDFQSPRQPGLRMHDWGSPEATDHSWGTARVGDRLEFHRRVWHPTQGPGMLTISSGLLTFPRLGFTDRWVSLSLLGLVLGLLSTWFAARFIASRVLLLHLTVPESAPIPSLLVSVCEPPVAAGYPSSASGREVVRSFLHLEEANVEWHRITREPAAATIPGSIQIWDCRQQAGGPAPEMITRWLHDAVIGECQVIVLVSSADVARGLGTFGAVRAGTWTLSPDGDPTTAVLAGMAREYERRWTGCSPSERRVLWEVAKSGFEDAANPAVAALLRTGLLRLDPKLRVPGASWRRFILTVAPVDPLPAETEAPDNSWRIIRTILVVAALGIMAFLMLTQPDTWQRTTGVVAGLLAGFKLMGDFMGTFRREASGSAGGK